MATFEVVRQSGLSVGEAWTRLTDWQRHGHAMPLTKVSVNKPSSSVGTRFVARTGIGPLGFDDPMEVTYWQPPTESTIGVCRIVKLGRVVRGEAELTVSPVSGGSEVRWREEASLAFGGRALDAVNRQFGRLLFGRLIARLLR
jgi:Polyketide cyclase / dehydrase and lipid transport